jgi:hypothetical protein
LPPLPSDLIFADGFESGTTGAWSSTASNSGRLSVGSAAALSNTLGMSATISNRTDTYVADSSPASLSTYHARFQFDPNGVTIPTTKTHVLFSGLASNGNKSVVIQVRQVGTGYEIRTGARLNSGTVKYGAWTAVADAPHSVEIGWSAATTSSGTNGSLALWIDGSPGPVTSALANGSQRIDDARLGPQTIPSGVSGVEYFDGFASTTASYIGP